MANVFSLLKEVFGSASAEPSPAVPSLAANDASTSADAPLKTAYADLLTATGALKDGQTVAAVSALNKSFIGFLSVGDHKAAGMIQKIIGLVLESEKNIDRARKAYLDSIDLLRRAKLPAEAVQVCLIGARIEARLLEFNKAFSLLRQAVSISKEANYPLGEIKAKYTQGGIEAHRGRFVEARQCLFDAQVAAQRSEDPEAKQVLAEFEKMLG